MTATDVKPSFKLSLVKLASALLAGILAVLAYPYSGSLTPLVFFFFILLFFTLENSKGILLVGVACVFSLTFNLGTTYWLLFYEPAVSVWAIVIASLQMSLVIITIQSAIYLLPSSPFKYFIWVPLWLTYEYWNHRWDLSMPMLTLGNFFSIKPNWVQWYEYTGVLGGSFWIMIVNVTAFLLFKETILRPRPTKPKKSIVAGAVTVLVILICIPIWSSHALLRNEENPVGNINIAVVQPNIDPFNEKFHHTSDSIQQLDKLFSLLPAYQELDLIIGPETAISRGYFIHEGLKFKPLSYAVNKLQEHDQVAMVLGAFTAEIVDLPSPAAKDFDDARLFESYNSAVFILPNGQLNYEHKSKLLPWAEQIPFISILPSLEELAVKVNITKGSLTADTSPHIFHSDRYSFASAICVEGIYGEFLGSKVSQGAQFLTLITNDGWWGNSIILGQLSSLTSLRAIEARRWILRSANTGISSIIDHKGKFVQIAPWNTAQALTHSIPLLTRETVYVRYGDYLGRLSLTVSLIIFVYMLARVVKIKLQINS